MLHPPCGAICDSIGAVWVLHIFNSAKSRMPSSQYKADHDIVPTTTKYAGCGTWPAFWTLGDGDNWPSHGEVDIIEGANNQAKNAAAAHYAGQCKVSKDSIASGISGNVLHDNCNYYDTDPWGAEKNPTGCQVRYFLSAGRHR